MLHVELTCLQGLADLERLEGPWLEELVLGDPEQVAVILRLFLVHMGSMNKRPLGAMVIDRLDAAERTPASKAVGRNQVDPPL